MRPHFASRRALLGRVALALITAAAFSGAAFAREGQVAPQPPPPANAQQKQERPALSAEDAALVQQLALLEKVELLRHLELFEKEPPPQPKRPPQQQ